MDNHVRCLEDIESELFNDENVKTDTSSEQVIAVFYLNKYFLFFI